MTEKTLEKAIKIKQKIDILRRMKEELEYHERLCWGNDSEVKSRTFEAKITDINLIKTVSVSPQSLQLALNNEIKNVNELLNSHLTELHELH